MPVVAIDAREAQDPVPRGTGRYARELVRALETVGGEGDPELLIVDRGGGRLELAWEQITFPRVLRANCAAAVHSTNTFLPLRRPCPGAVTIHDLAFEAHPEDFSRRTGWKYRTFARRAARSAERVICPSEFTRDDVCRRYGVDPARTRVIPEAPALAHGDEPPPPGPYLLAIGDLRVKKNLVRLAEAFRLLRADGLEHRLLLAGTDRGEGERIVAAAGGEPVELCGFVTDARLDALIRGADVVVHPSLHEGFGLALAEAMARGRAVAAARATALPETGGDACAWFDPLDVDDMAAVVGRLARDRELAAELGERGRRRAAELSWERAARATLDVYRELVR